MRPKNKQSSTKSGTKTLALSRWLDQHQPTRISEYEFAEIHRALLPISESYLRKLLRNCGVPLSPLVESVRQSTPDELEASLLKLLDEYQRSDRTRQAAIRRLVITAKEHSRLALLKLKDDNARSQKEEAILWMTTWLENPPLFPDWVSLRRNRL